MPRLNNVIKISKENYNTLQGGGQVWKDGAQHVYDSNAVYLVEGGYTGVQGPVGLQGYKGLNGGIEYTVKSETVDSEYIDSDYDSFTYWIFEIPSNSQYTAFRFTFGARYFLNLFGYTYIYNKTNSNVTVTIGEESGGAAVFAPNSVITISANCGVEISSIITDDSFGRIAVLTYSPILHSV